MDEMGMVMLFAGVQKDDPTKLHAIMKFADLEAFQAFGSNEELTEERKKAGAVVESGVMTMIYEDDFFTNGEEFAYIFDDGKWTCYALTHKYDDDYNVTSYIAKPVDIPSKAVA